MNGQAACAQLGVLEDRPNLGGDVARVLRALIFSGELEPGQRLPSEKEMAVQMGVSHPTVRSGLSTLRESGLIVTFRGVRGGSNVSEAEQLDECWREWANQNRENIEAVFEFQIILEMQIAQLAAERRTEDDLELMKEAIRRERVGFLPLSQFRPDTDFHLALAAAARNPRLGQMSNKTRSQVFLPLWRAPSEEWREGGIDNHEDILLAVRDQDAAEAAEQMRRHLVRAQSFIRSCVLQSTRHQAA